VQVPFRSPISCAADEWWTSPPDCLALDEGEVHIWRGCLPQPEETAAALCKTLSADEHQRAQRFVFEPDRQRFICARGILRMLLGRYLGQAPENLRFSYSRYGKPALAHPAKSPIGFNLSHSHELVLCAFARNREIGVDVEHVREDRATREIAERFFSEHEVAMLRSLPAEEQAKAFFDCWTRKEAYIKGRGEGLSFPLKQFDVSLLPGAPAALLACRDQANPRALLWTLREISAGAGYAAAIAVEGDNQWQARQWQWE
jgi:4'-phosphopantetheinyl transferase